MMGAGSVAHRGFVAWPCASHTGHPTATTTMAGSNARTHVRSLRGIMTRRGVKQPFAPIFKKKKWAR